MFFLFHAIKSSRSLAERQTVEEGGEYNRVLILPGTFEWMGLISGRSREIYSLSCNKC